MPGINISGNIVNNLRYADDTVLIADNEQDLQNIVDTIHRQSKEFGLDMNVKKTKTMVYLVRQKYHGWASLSTTTYWSKSKNSLT